MLAAKSNNEWEGESINRRHVIYAHTMFGKIFLVFEFLKKKTRNDGNQQI